jgi:phage repressor protein C with HTH and peptisase S24 domain
MAEKKPAPVVFTPAQQERAEIGEALTALRETRKLHQKHIAGPLGMTPQAWQHYEAGNRNFTDEKINAALKAMGATRAEFEFELARRRGLSPPPTTSLVRREEQDLIIPVYGRARAGPQGIEVYDVGEPLRTIDLRQILGPHTDALEVAGDSMVPWAEPGEVVLFDRDRYPRRGYGCVIETKAGEAYVKLYERTDGSTLFVRELFPEERTVTFEMKDLKGFYAVKFRGD